MTEKEDIDEFIKRYWGAKIDLWGISLLKDTNPITVSTTTLHESFTDKVTRDMWGEYKGSEEEEGEDLGDRFNDGKLRWDLLDFEAFEGTVKVMMNGEKKYGKNNWTKGMKISSIMNSLMRHVFSFQKGETLDLETGETHLSHIMANAMMAQHMLNNKRHLDDRSK